MVRSEESSLDPKNPLLRRGVRLRFIEPGKPVQNPFVESFNGRFRDPKQERSKPGSPAGGTDSTGLRVQRSPKGGLYGSCPLVECLNQYWFHSSGHAGQELARWRHHYNSERPHSALGYRSPSEFMATALPSPQQAQAPVLPAALEPDPTRKHAKTDSTSLRARRSSPCPFLNSSIVWP